MATAAPVVAPALTPVRPARVALGVAVIAVILAALVLCAWQGYLLFHSIVEIFSVAVASAIFMVSWSSRTYLEAKPFLVLGISYIFVAVLDTAHLLSYNGMGVLPNTTDDATRLWVAARGLQALATLAFVLLARRRYRPHPAAIFGVAGVLMLLALASVFWWNVFPLCFVEGVGVTPFKKAAEYVIAAIFLFSTIEITRDTGAVTLRERRLLAASFALTAASELIFTLYTSSYGTANLVGHILKIASFYCAYLALFAGKIQGRVSLITQLEKSRAELESANAAKDKFFSIMAHDLKNAIAGLVTVSELLTKRYDELGPAKVRDLSRLLHEGALNSAELLECILQWARAQSGRLQVHPSEMRMAELCDGILELERPAAAAKEIRLESAVARDATAWADADMVATVLRNLVTNALKFTPRGGQVGISAESTGGWLALSVEDNGVGMSAADLNRLFRIDNSFTCPGTESEKGHGMGLILCRELVGLNRGTISVTSKPACGTKFTVRLPISR